MTTYALRHDIMHRDRCDCLTSGVGANYRVIQSAPSMYKTFNKFFNRLGINPRDREPDRLLRTDKSSPYFKMPTPQEPISMTRADEPEFGIGTSKHREFCARIKSRITQYLGEKCPTCKALSDQLNEDGEKTASGGRWNKRLIFLFTRSYMAERPALDSSSEPQWF